MKLTHNSVSYVKSFVRILAGLSLIYATISVNGVWYVVACGVLIILAEVLGIIEEIV